MWLDDMETVGTLIVAVAAIPYVVEIIGQLPLLACVMRVLPKETRTALPRHPRHPWLAVFGSARFFRALFRLVFRRSPADGPEVVALKCRMRASMLREALFGVLFWTTAVALWRRGWRPTWP